jgi:hypothetical protein
MRQEHQDQSGSDQRRDCAGKNLGKARRALWLRVLSQVGFETAEHCGRNRGIHSAMEIRVDRGDEPALLGEFHGAVRAGLCVLANCGRHVGAGYGGFDQLGLVFFT